MKHLPISLMGLAIALATPTLPAAAADTSLMGDRLRVNWALPNDTSTWPGFSVDGQSRYDFTVGQGVEGVGTLDPLGSLSFDFTAHSLTLTFLDNILIGSHAFNGLIFRELDGSSFANIQSVSGLNPDAVRIDNDRLLVNLRNVRVTSGDIITVQFDSGVPEPASWALLIVGFGACGAMLRRVQKARGRLAFA